MVDPSPSYLSPLASPWHQAEGRDEGAMWLAWLVRLRWVAIIGQVVTLSFSVQVLDTPVLVIPALLGAVGLLAVVNTFALRQLHRHESVGPSTLLVQLLVDVAVLTGFFLAAGGSDNPFVMLYLIHVAIGAVMLPTHFAALLMGLVVVANAALHRFGLPIHLDRHAFSPHTLAALGQIVAFSVTVASVGIFVLGMAGTFRRQKQRLMEAHERTARTDRLRAVGTLAAGAAHELNTPLSTMDLRLRRLGRRHGDEATRDDLEAVRGQLARCKAIVEQLLLGAGDPSASGFARRPLQAFVGEALRWWSKGAPVYVQVRMDDEPVLVELPTVAFTQAFINLLENAREAQEEAGVSEPLEVSVVREAGRGVVLIHDRGPGLPVEADRVGEPFFTTKPTGTGLGVFVARTLADGAGGGLEYVRREDRTITRWYFPEIPPRSPPSEGVRSA